MRVPSDVTIFNFSRQQLLSLSYIMYFQSFTSFFCYLLKPLIECQHPNRNRLLSVRNSLRSNLCSRFHGLDRRSNWWSQVLSCNRHIRSTCGAISGRNTFRSLVPSTEKHFLVESTVRVYIISTYSILTDHLFCSVYGITTSWAAIFLVSTGTSSGFCFGAAKNDEFNFMVPGVFIM